MSVGLHYQRALAHGGRATDDLHQGGLGYDDSRDCAQCDPESLHGEAEGQRDLGPAGPARDGEQDGEHQEICKHGRAPITEEGSHYTGERQHARSSAGNKQHL